jgi:hypothetical protein
MHTKKDPLERIYKKGKGPKILLVKQKKEEQKQKDRKIPGLPCHVKTIETINNDCSRSTSTSFIGREWER